MEAADLQTRAQAPSAPSLGNPLPLGLLGYGMSTVLLSFVNADIYSLGTMVLAMAILFGGSLSSWWRSWLFA